MGSLGIKSPAPSWFCWSSCTRIAQPIRGRKKVGKHAKPLANLKCVLAADFRKLLASQQRFYLRPKMAQIVRYSLNLGSCQTQCRSWPTACFFFLHLGAPSYLHTVERCTHPHPMSNTINLCNHTLLRSSPCQVKWNETPPPLHPMLDHFFSDAVRQELIYHL